MNAEASAPTWAERDRKIGPRHHERLAVVYVRQSTLQQVQRHRESTQAQYGLADLAARMGWPKDRVLVIDEDLGQSGASADGRAGFQRLLGEVALDRVGIILGVEMSRLARSCKDWYQLLELCAIFGTLICDLDGLYDPATYNDRLLLGLKGTMSEAELHVIRQRMLQGARQKARRGELVTRVPMGYVRDGQGQVQLDPDEQVRGTVSAIFEAFARTGSAGGVLSHMRDAGMQFGLRAADGPDRGRLVWRRPNKTTIRNMLVHPMYAGAYVYGRRGQHKGATGPLGRYFKPDKEWLVLLRDRMPAYITWDQYEANLRQLQSNRSAQCEKGAIRSGGALLAGLVICGRCGRRLITSYGGSSSLPRYDCKQAAAVYGEPRCQGLAAASLDAEVARLTLLALEPSALEVSLRVAGDLQAQHDAAARSWRQRIERAQYEADRARRQYESVEPENRLVARTVEAEWEQKLSAHRDLLEQHERFLREQPRLLTPDEQGQIRSLASDLPMLWNATTTTDEDKKTILRQVVEKIVINIEGNTEWVEARIHWIGGQQTYTRLRRPVARIEQLSKFTMLRKKILEWYESDLSAPQIARRLNEEGERNATGGSFTEQSVRTWVSRYGRGPAVNHSYHPDDRPAEGECFAADLARRLDVNMCTVARWLRDGRLHGRRQLHGNRAWIVRVTDDELRELMAFRQDKPGPQGDGPRRSYPRRKQQGMSGGAV
jgi:DNA invertase Pin-like site-specific DNA recombinase